jgi:hypothetical protein
MSDPGLFCWGGRCPHFDWSWNTDQRLVWRARTNTAGFNPGNSSGWGTHDNQHVSFGHIRYSWLETGDALLEEWLKYQITMFAVGYFSDDWNMHPEAERAFGRSLKEALEMSAMFPDLPETKLLRSRFPVKIAAEKAGIAATFARFGHYGNDLFDACDERVMGGHNCPIQQALGQGPIVSVDWQEGFVQEVWSMLDNPDLNLLA